MRAELRIFDHQPQDTGESDMSNSCVCGTSKSNLECTFIIYRHEESLEWHHATTQRLFEENI